MVMRITSSKLHHLNPSHSTPASPTISPVIMVCRAISTSGIHCRHPSARDKPRTDPSALYDFRYPTTETSLINNFWLDPGYVKRYRDPARHDDYVLADHHDPYHFRTRPPTATQTSPLCRAPAHLPRVREGKPPHFPYQYSPVSQPPALRPSTSHSSFKSIALCFPGTGSQYIGMGSFLNDCAKSFKSTWQEAEESLVGFEAFRKSLDLVDRFQALGYSREQAELLGGPMRRGALMAGTTDGGGKGLMDVVFNGPQNELTRSSNAQPAILITSIAYLRSLENDFGTPIRSLTRVFAGHSSGEFSACVSAGVMDFRTGVQLTRLLGLLTTRTLELNALHPSTCVTAPDDLRAQMSALLINPATSSTRKSRSVYDVFSVVEEMKKEKPGQLVVEVGSVNSSSQVVLSGTKAGVLSVCERLHELEVANRAADLPCFSPFHCSIMKPASEGLKVALESVPLKPPTGPIILSSPTTSTPLKAPRTHHISSSEDLTDLRLHLSESLQSPVWWSETMNQLLSRQDLNRLVFVGPGRALNNMCRKEMSFRIKGLVGASVEGQREIEKARGSGCFLRSLATLEEFKVIRDEVQENQS